MILKGLSDSKSLSDTKQIRDAINIRYSTMLREELAEALALRCGPILVPTIGQVIDTQQAIGDVHATTTTTTTTTAS